MAMRAVFFITYQSLIFEQLLSYTLSDYAVNVALGKPTNQSTTYIGSSIGGDTSGFRYSASLAVDGNKNTNFSGDSCSSTDANGNNAWWSLDLQDLYYVTRINIYQRAGPHKNRNVGSTLSGLQDNDTYIQLMTFGSTDTGDIKTNLSLPVPIKGIQIEHKGKNVFVSFCEVEVFAEVNVARGKPASQSPPYEGSTAYNAIGPYNACLAVDGNTDTRLHGNSCSHTYTRDKTAWWTVDLQALYSVIGIRIFQRTDLGNNATLNGFRIFGILANRSYEELQTPTPYQTGVIDIAISPSKIFKGIMVDLYRANQEQFAIMTICELQVFAVVSCHDSLLQRKNSFLEYHMGIYGNLTYNSTVSIRCREGYSLIGKDHVRCLANNLWDGTLGNCSVVRCYESLLQRKNSFLEYHMGIDGNLTYNSTLSIRCLDGYTLIGTDHVRCLADSVWDGTLGNCSVVRCVDDSLQRTNSILEYQSGIEGNLTYNAMVYIRCKVGYSLTGIDRVRCIADGRWNGIIGYCSVVRCYNSLLQRKNSFIEYHMGIAGNLTYNSTVSIRCRQGFTLIGTGHVRCLADSLWDGTLGNCSVKRCVDKSLHRNNSILSYQSGIEGNLTYNAMVYIRCMLGYSLTGIDRVRCIEDRHWNGIIGHCSVVRCVDKYLQRNNSVLVYQSGIEGNLTYNASVSIGCQMGYTLTGTALARCNENSRWNGTLGNCSVVRCYNSLLQRKNSFIEYDMGIAGNLTYNSTVSIKCREGYNLIGTDHVRCLADSFWDGTLGNCSAMRCVDKSLQRSNSILVYQSGIEGNLTYNALVYIRCKVGYNLTGIDRVRCIADGRWNGTLGHCSVVRCVGESFQRNNSVLVYQSGIEGNLTYNATVSVGCQVGYTLTGTNLVRCNANSNWEGTLGNCSVVRCVGESLQRNNSVIIYQSGIEGNLTYNATVSVECQVGYTLTGTDLVRCNASSNWEGTLGNCSVVRCVDKYLQRNNSVLVYQSGIEGNLTYNASVSIGCQMGFTLTGTDRVSCNENSHWDGTLGNCTATEAYIQPDKIVAGVAGGIAAAIFIIILIVIIAVIFNKRRMRGLKYEDNDNNLTDIPSTSHKCDGNDTTMSQKEMDAQPRIKKRPSPGSECDESKHVYMNTSDSTSDYYDFTPKKVTDKHSVRVEDLSSFFMSRKIDTSFYEEEYNKLPNGLIKPHDDAILPENRPKNRYKNIYPYDDTRVKLDIWDPSTENDYINACYIQGFNRVNAYIAAQGPTKGILNDFWRMIWQNKCSKIVMLTNLTEEGKHKCEQYWPQEGSVDYGDIVIRLIQCETFSDFKIRTLEMKKTNGTQHGVQNKTYQIKQFHFTAWPDRGVPRFASSLVHFRHKIRATKTDTNSDGPMVIHCSAGIGRTGTFLALDYLVEQAEELGYINVVSCVEILRKQRVNLIQTVEQYIFLHEAIIEALICNTNVMSTSEFKKTYIKLLERDTNTGKRKLDDDFEKLPMYVSDPGEDVYENATNMDNRAKNRYSNILPNKSHCPFLNVHVKGRDSYINAVFLPAYMENDIFILTQTPLQNTVVDFWRMDDERYWTENQEQLEILPFRITLESKSCNEICINYNLLLHYNDERRKVRLSRATYWPDGKPVPTSPSAVLKHIDQILKWQQETGNKHIVVHCMNGADRSGLFCVIASLLERIKIEQDVAVEQIIKQMRSRRPQIIPNVDQFKFCYDAVLDYLDQFDTYSNFTGL